MNDNARRILHTLKRFAEQKQDLLLEHLVLDLEASLLREGEVDGLPPKVRALADAGNRIGAVKVLRGEFLGTSDPRGTLCGARDVVDAYMEKHGRVS